MSNSTWELDEIEDIIGEVFDYAENCSRAEEEGWFYPDPDDENGGDVHH